MADTVAEYQAEVDRLIGELAAGNVGENAFLEGMDRLEDKYPLASAVVSERATVETERLLKKGGWLAVAAMCLERQRIAEGWLRDAE